jgi:hypothetical protein
VIARKPGLPSGRQELVPLLGVVLEVLGPGVPDEHALRAVGERTAVSTLAAIDFRCSLGSRYFS